MNWEILYHIGYPGLFVMSFLAATIIPFSSETIFSAMLLLDYSPVYCILTATTGNWLGGLASYFVGKTANWKKIEKLIGVKKEKVLKLKNKIDKFGTLLAFFSWLPIVGDGFAIALGYFKVNLASVAFFMLLGKLLRFIVASIIVLFLYNHLT